jgi:hypothetical protein
MSRWQELSANVYQRLADMNNGQQAMFACAVAERLLSRHEALPSEQQAEFTIGLRPLLNAAWDMACGDQTQFTSLKRGLGEFYLSDYCHDDGQDGPNDADESAAAAILYAAEFAMHGCLEFAAVAGLRGEEAADEARYTSTEQLAEGAEEDALVHEELERQLVDLDLIAHYADDLRYTGLGCDIDTISRLRREVRDRLSV